MALTLIIAGGVLFSESSVRVRRVVAPEPRWLLKSHTSAAVQTVPVTVGDGSELEAWYINAGRKAGKCVVVLHGIGDSRAGSVGFAPMFLDAGYSVLLPDSRAHGRSGGEFVTYGLFEKYDLLSWTRWLKGAGCADIYGLGESLGGAVLIQTSEIEPVFRAVAAECAYSDLRSIARYRFQQMIGVRGQFGETVSRVVVGSGMLFARMRHGFDFGQVSPRTSILRAKTPTLLIHGSEDEQTPAAHSVAMAAATRNAALWLVPGAGHVEASVVDPDGFRTRVLGWFAEH